MRTLIAAAVGGACGAAAFYLLASQFGGAVSPPLSGVVAVACYEWALRRRVRNARGGALLGLLAGVVMSAFVAVATIFTTGVGTLEFAAAVTFLPVIVCALSTLGGWIAAFFFANG